MRVGPLAGRRIAVTRRPEQAGTLVARLAELGADVVELPTVAIVPPEDWRPLDDALRQLHRYDWIVFTSANAVTSVADRLSAEDLDGGAIGRGTAVAAVGPATAQAFRERFPGREVEIQPRAEFRAEGLAEALTSRGIAGQRFLVPLSDRARPVLKEAIEAAGGRVDAVVAYRTAPPETLAERVRDLAEQGVDLLTFASPSAVENLVAAAGDAARGLPAAVIGPVTEASARRAGLDVRVVAEPSTVEGLVAALVRLLDTRSA
jgi:uroporphyrinogen III methyltransferase/synthase